MKKSLSQKLADNLAYYVADPAKRRCSDGKQCRYSGKTIGKKTVGCFVGRFMSAKDRIIADANIISLRSLIEKSKSLGIKLPKIIRENEPIIYSFQVLHDSADNWGERGLSRIGKYELKRIIETHSLEEKFFDEFLVD
jgi:hypothetical protein